nr:MAG TPA: actin-like protein [Caudoviricetes sp.]
MCMAKPPKPTPAPPPPPPVLEQVAPKRTSGNPAANQRSGTKKYRAGGTGLSIGGLGGSSSGVGVGT